MYRLLSRAVSSTLGDQPVSLGSSDPTVVKHSLKKLTLSSLKTDDVKGTEERDT